jgi:hypothetical protein
LLSKDETLEYQPPLATNLESHPGFETKSISLQNTESNWKSGGMIASFQSHFEQLPVLQPAYTFSQGTFFSNEVSNTAMLPTQYLTIEPNTFPSIYQGFAEHHSTNYQYVERPSQPYFTAPQETDYALQLITNSMEDLIEDHSLRNSSQ